MTTLFFLTGCLLGAILTSVCCVTRVKSLEAHLDRTSERYGRLRDAVSKFNAQQNARTLGKVLETYRRDV